MNKEVVSRARLTKIEAPVFPVPGFVLRGVQPAGEKRCLAAGDGERDRREYARRFGDL
jgi:hypothetical protein